MAENRTEIQQARNELREAERLGQPESIRAARKRLAALGVDVTVQPTAADTAPDADEASRLLDERTKSRTATVAEQVRRAAKEAVR